MRQYLGRVVNLKIFASLSHTPWLAFNRSSLVVTPTSWRMKLSGNSRKLWEGPFVHITMTSPSFPGFLGKSHALWFTKVRLANVANNFTTNYNPGMWRRLATPLSLSPFITLISATYILREPSRVSKLLSGNYSWQLEVILTHII